MPFDKLKQTLQHMGKTPVDEQLQYAEKLKGNDQLKNYMSKMEKEREIVEQLNNERTPFFENIGNKLKNAADIITEPAEYDELDTSGYLPNQQLAGQGANKMLRAISAVSPEEKDYPVVGIDPTGKPMRFDPTAVMGIIKSPEEIGHIVQNLKNPTKENVLKALKYNINDPYSDKNFAYNKLLESAARKRIGQDPTIPLISGKYDIQTTQNDILQDLYSGVNKLKNQNKVLFFEDAPKLLPSYANGSARVRTSGLRDSQIDYGPRVPEAVILRDIKNLGTTMHEAEHVQNALTNQKIFSKPYNTPTTLQEFVNKVNRFDKNIKIPLDRSILNQNTKDVLIKNNIDPLEFNQFEHFTDPDYIKNYELNKALEILQGTPKKLDPDSIVNNYEILNNLLEDVEHSPITVREADKMARERGFQTLDQLLKKK